MDVGGNIKRLRISHNISQGELAKKLEIAQPTLSQIERGTKTPSMQLGRKIAKIFGCTMEDLCK